MSLDPAARLCLATIVAAHGVRGAVKLKTFTGDPADVAAYGPLTDDHGRVYRLKLVRVVTPGPDGSAIDTVDGVKDRNEAEALRGAQLHVARSALPAPEEDAFYHADLIGLPAATSAGEPLGKVTAVLNFGAGDVLELTVEGHRSLLVPFTKAAVPLVDIKAGRLVVDPPPELGDPEPGEAPGAEPVTG